MPKNITPENTGTIVCKIHYRKDGKLRNFANGLHFSSILEFQNFFLNQLLNKFPLLVYENGIMHLSRGTIKYEKFKLQVYEINAYISEYNFILKDLGVEGVLPMISEECWNLLKATEDKLAFANQDIESTRANLETKIENQDKIIAYLCKELDIDLKKLEENKSDLTSKKLEDFKNFKKK